MRLMFDMDLEINNLKKSIRQANKNVIAKTSQETSDFFKKRYKEAITHFYRDYVPKFYKRVNNFRNNSYDIQISASGSIASEVLFEASPEKMYGGYKDVFDNPLTNEEVQRAFEAVMWGYHGMPQIHITEPSFYTVIENMAEDLDINGILETAIISELGRV